MQSHKPKKNSDTPSQKKDISTSTDTMRLNRFIATAGVCSRREADVLIKSGKIEVNGKVVTEMGQQVGANDVVKYEGKALFGEKLVYILLNKPKDFITTVTDTHDRKTVMDLIKAAGKERVVPVGRLDKDTTGLLLFTNDGELTKKLTHPSHMVRKLYHVQTDLNIHDDDIAALLKGIELEDGFVKADEATRIDGGEKNEIGLLMHSGRNRIVRRMMKHLGYDVVKLDRVVFANLTKKDIPRGKWRRLESKEVILLKRIVGNK